jgi:hypothetical protein
MSTETKPAVTFSIFILPRLEPLHIYKTAVDVSKEFKANFVGMYPYSFPNPNRDGHYISFVVELEIAEKIKEKVKEKLGLTDEAILCTGVPTVLHKEKPVSNDAMKYSN